MCVIRAPFSCLMERTASQYTRGHHVHLYSSLIGRTIYTCVVQCSDWSNNKHVEAIWWMIGLWYNIYATWWYYCTDVLYGYIIVLYDIPLLLISLCSCCTIVYSEVLYCTLLRQYIIIHYLVDFVSVCVFVLCLYLNQ